MTSNIPQDIVKDVKEHYQHGGAKEAYSALLNDINRMTPAEQKEQWAAIQAGFKSDTGANMILQDMAIDFVENHFTDMQSFTLSDPFMIKVSGDEVSKYMESQSGPNVDNPSGQTDVGALYAGNLIKGEWGNVVNQMKQNTVDNACSLATNPFCATASLTTEFNKAFGIDQTVSLEDLANYHLTLTVNGLGNVLKNATSDAEKVISTGGQYQASEADKLKEAEQVFASQKPAVAAPVNPENQTKDVVPKSDSTPTVLEDDAKKAPVADPKTLIEKGLPELQKLTTVKRGGSYWDVGEALLGVNRHEKALSKEEKLQVYELMNELRNLNNHKGLHPGNQLLTNEMVSDLFETGPVAAGKVDLSKYPALAKIIQQRLAASAGAPLDLPALKQTQIEEAEKARQTKK